MENETAKFNVTVPSSLLDEFDKEIQEARYGTRSEAIREAMRDLLQKLRKRQR